MDWMLLPYRRYFEFSGRSRRKEFWLFTLFTVVVSLIISAIWGGPMTVVQTGFSVTYARMLSTPGQWLQNLFGLVSFIPSLAVSVRRLHDSGRSGWWLLLWLLPVLGWFTLLVFYCLDSAPGGNAYGSDPKFQGVGEVFR